MSRRLLLAAVTLATLAATGLATPAHAVTWAPAATATVHPGVQLLTAGAQCTANFVYTSVETVYLGYAAHCAGTGEATDTDGCLAGSLPVGTAVEITGASRPGVLAYSSWRTMQARGEPNADTCAYNDLALVRIDPADVPKVNPSIPRWGGPTGINTAGAPATDAVYSYGNSSLRGGITLLSPKQGLSVGDAGGGWSHTVYTVTPGIPGDSGSAFLDKGGRALGVLSTVALAPLALSNGVGDLSRELAYARTYGGLGNVQLALGTEPFRP
jgi:hypothetical protein